MASSGKAVVQPDGSTTVTYDDGSTWNSRTNVRTPATGSSTPPAPATPSDAPAALPPPPPTPTVQPSTANQQVLQSLGFKLGHPDAVQVQNADGTVTLTSAKTGETVKISPDGSKVLTGANGVSATYSADGKTITSSTGVTRDYVPPKATPDSGSSPDGRGAVGFEDPNNRYGDGTVGGGGSGSKGIHLINGQNAGGTGFDLTPITAPADKAVKDAASTIPDWLQSLVDQLTYNPGDLSVDTSGVQSDIDAARHLREQFNNAYLAAHPGEAPKIDPTLLGPQERVTAADAAATHDATAGHGVSSDATAGRGEASLATASQLDPTQQAEFRARQTGLADYLNTVIAGKTPSVAQLQMIDALQKNEANQLGLASKASGGGNAFLAMQNAANQIGRLNQGASSDGALLRAKEEADARAELATVLGQARTSDITMADRNATLSTDVSKTNASNLTNTSNSNAGLWTDVSKTNATNATTTSNANAGRDTDVSLAAALARNNAALQHERELNAAAKTNADNSTTLNVNQGTIASGEKKANATNTIEQQKADETAKQNAATDAINTSGQSITGGGNLVDSLAKIQAAKAAADNNTRAQAGSALAWLWG